MPREQVMVPCGNCVGCQLTGKCMKARRMDLLPDPACTWCGHSLHAGACPELVLVPVEIGVERVRTVGEATRQVPCRCANIARTLDMVSATGNVSSGTKTHRTPAKGKK